MPFDIHVLPLFFLHREQLWPSTRSGDPEKLYKIFGAAVELAKIH